MPSHEEPPETPRFGLVDALAMPVYDLGEGHPFARDRQEALFDLLARMQLVDDDQRMPAPEATRAELELAHDPEYIDMVAATSVEAPTSEVYEKALSFGLGTSDNPIAPNQHLAASRVAGATLDCVRQVISGKLKYAFNPTGGLHHAAHRAASGFCIYNDLVVGIRGARDAGLPRVLYVDFDVHHGDGTFLDPLPNDAGNDPVGEDEVVSRRMAEDEDFAARPRILPADRKGAKPLPADPDHGQVVVGVHAEEQVRPVVPGDNNLPSPQVVYRPEEEGANPGLLLTSKPCRLEPPGVHIALTGCPHDVVVELFVC